MRPVLPLLRRLLPLVALFVLTLGDSALAAPGDLDTTFSVDGKVVTNMGGFDLGYGVAVQPDGKVVVAGRGGASPNFAVARYNPDGRLDPSFSGDGKTRNDVGSNAEGAYDVAVQPDGKIVTAGYTYRSASNFNFALVRYNANGTLDKSFSGDGKMVIDFYRSFDVAFSVSILASGKIVAVGTGVNAGNQNIAVARINPNGTRDKTFSGDGRLLTSLGPEPDWALDSAVLPDGKVVAAGYSDLVGGRRHIATVRYEANGTLDKSFSADGKVRTAISDIQRGSGVRVREDGRIVVVGDGVNAPSGGVDFLVVQYLPDGSLDPEFGSGGHAFHSLSDGEDVGNDVMIQPDGKLVLVGASQVGDDAHEANMALVRLEANGAADETFATGGDLTTDFGGTTDTWYSGVLQGDGKIVTSGAKIVGDTAADFTVARYLGA